MKIVYEIVNEMNDDQGNPTCWATKINNQFWWITEQYNGYVVEMQKHRGGNISALMLCKTLKSAKAWLTKNWKYYQDED